MFWFPIECAGERMDNGGVLCVRCAGLLSELVLKFRTISNRHRCVQVHGRHVEEYIFVCICGNCVVLLMS